MSDEDARAAAIKILVAIATDKELDPGHRVNAAREILLITQEK